MKKDEVIDLRQKEYKRGYKKNLAYIPKGKYKATGCEICQKEFIPTVKNQITCESSGCKKKLKKRHNDQQNANKKKERVKKKCVVCGDEFEGYEHVKTCGSKDCLHASKHYSTETRRNEEEAKSARKGNSFLLMPVR